MAYEVNFLGYNCILNFGQYANGRTAIQLIDVEDGAPVAIATVNVPEYDLAADEVVIKSYSENIGVLDALINANIVRETGRFVNTGYISAPVCKLLVSV